MCGIAVHFSSSSRATPLDLQLLTHRGPDSSGEWSSADGRCWLGSTRLAIVDLSPTGAQPMIDSATGNVIVMNGEIYNHRALRDLLGPNVNWRGTSDTETLLHGYARWRHGVLDRIKGMFAFAIYDNAREELFLARDRLGIKPLYYTLDAHGVRFASEVKALAGAGEAITAESISAYLQWGACPEKNLLYSNIHALPAGYAMTIARQGQRDMWRYWPSRQAFVSSTDQVVRQVRGLINKAVEEHLLSDVPVASFLSGGIDSSIVTAIAAQKLERKLQTFSVAFDLAEFDESAIALEIARRYRTDHHRIELSEEEVIHSVMEAVDKLDLPSVDAINTYIVSRAVAKHGVKVALSGLGGDGLFGGYASFRDVPRLKIIARLPRGLRRMLGATGNLGDRLADLPSNAGAGDLAKWRRRFFTDSMLDRAGLPNGTTPIECPVELPDDYARISWAELTGYMRRILLRDADQMSMAVSLELRVPFLDHEVVEYVLGLPAVEKKRYAGSKGLLVEACRDLLPPSVYQRPKSGFVLPMTGWMRGPLAPFVDEGVRETIARELLPEDFVNGISRAFCEDRLHWTRLWNIVVLGHFAKPRKLSGQLARRSDEDTSVHSLA
ncbi:MAG: asparagine synthase (glutamine-hydrolyzing) [Verrucomicrobia bacterium]|nr:MAG: asparagine synthase (glutamine-hydrolyzing) [Verrucomicrobiota bacterium]